MLISEKRSICAIARKLNGKGVARVGGSKWDHYAIRAIVTHPKYAGFAVFGRTSSKLRTPRVKLPKSEWIVKPGAFEPIIDATTFAEAQKAYEGRTFNRTDKELLDDLRKLVASEGRLSLSIIQNSADTSSPSTYRNRFGSLRRAYELIGCDNPSEFSRADVRCRTMSLREELIAKIVAMFPNDISIVRRGVRWRSRLRFSSGLIISVLVARSVRAWKETRRWQIDPVPHERKSITLLARLDASDRSFLDFHVFPNIDRRTRFRISMNDSWLNRGKRVSKLSRLCEVVAQVRLTRRRKSTASG